MKAIVLALAAVLAAGAAAAHGALRPADVRAHLAAEGPSRTVAFLAGGNGAGWTAVLRHVARAEPAWLALVPGIRPGADAATGEALAAALSDALAVAPARVLPLAPAVIPLERLCSVPLIEPTAAQVARSRRARLAALAHVTGPARQEALDCRRLLAR